MTSRRVHSRVHRIDFKGQMRFAAKILTFLQRWMDDGVGEVAGCLRSDTLFDKPHEMWNVFDDMPLSTRAHTCRSVSRKYAHKLSQVVTNSRKMCYFIDLVWKKKKALKVMCHAIGNFPLPECSTNVCVCVCVCLWHHPDPSCFVAHDFVFSPSCVLCVLVQKSGKADGMLLRPPPNLHISHPPTWNPLLIPQTRWNCNFHMYFWLANLICSCVVVCHLHACCCCHDNVVYCDFCAFFFFPVELPGTRTYCVKTLYNVMQSVIR